MALTLSPNPAEPEPNRLRNAPSQSRKVRRFENPQQTLINTPFPQSDNANRWVAVIYGNVPITREELAEYLIERNSDKLELLVNIKLIEHACHLKGVDGSVKLFRVRRAQTSA